MHERKAKMAELAAGFIALPGGVGTLEEIFEQWGWARLGIHEKPCAFFDVDGFFEPVRAMRSQMLRAGFMLREHIDIITFSSDPKQILEAFRKHEPPSTGWFRALAQRTPASRSDAGGRRYAARQSREQT